jgi:hypothetical protein
MTRSSASPGDLLARGRRTGLLQRAPEPQAAADQTRVVTIGKYVRAIGQLTSERQMTLKPLLTAVPACPEELGALLNKAEQAERRKEALPSQEPVAEPETRR